MRVAEAAEKLDVAEPLAALRRSTTQWLLRERGRARRGTGVPELDAMLAGGWPQGRLSEVVGDCSSGASAIASATVAAAVGRGEVAAWIDVADALDPATMREAGVELERVLWVRPRGVTEAVRAAELVLEAGGFSLVVLDLGAGGGTVAGPRWSAGARRPRGGGLTTRSGAARGQGKGALPLRLARAVERAAAVVLVLVGRSWAGTLAGVTVVLDRGESLWGGDGHGDPRWLVGFSSSIRLERGGAGERQLRAKLRFEKGPGLRAPSPESQTQGQGMEEQEATPRERWGSFRASDRRPAVVPASGAWRPEVGAGGGGQVWAG